MENGGKLLEMVRAQSTLSSMFARAGTDESYISKSNQLSKSRGAVTCSHGRQAGEAVRNQNCIVAAQERLHREGRGEAGQDFDDGRRSDATQEREDGHGCYGFAFVHLSAEGWWMAHGARPLEPAQRHHPFAPHDAVHLKSVKPTIQGGL